jgi:hypothetical protein
VVDAELSVLEAVVYAELSVLEAVVDAELSLVEAVVDTELSVLEAEVASELSVLVADELSVLVSPSSFLKSFKSLLPPELPVVVVESAVVDVASAELSELEAVVVVVLSEVVAASEELVVAEEAAGGVVVTSAEAVNVGRSTPVMINFLVTSSYVAPVTSPRGLT